MTAGARDGGYRKFRRRYNSNHTVLSATSCSTLPSECGVVYLALGADHNRLAVTSISRLREVGYAGPIRVLTDTHALLDGGNGVEVVRVCVERNRYPARYYKTQIDKFAFRATLFLDVDMLAIAPIDGIWGHLEFADVCASLELPRVQEFVDYYWEREPRMRPELEYMRDARLTRHRFHNSGMILFRKGDAAGRLYRAWHDEWRRFGGMDQCALVRASARTGVRLHTLPSSWNCPAPRFDSIDEARELGVKFLHFFSGEPRTRLPIRRRPER